MVHWEKKKILVIDDSETNLLLLRAVLEDAGYDVELLDNSKKARAYIEEHEPDLILLDLLMPGMDGFEFMHQMNQGNWGKGYPVVVVTAYDSQDNKQKAKELGAVDVINKPIDISAFLTRVEQIVN